MDLDEPEVIGKPDQHEYHTGHVGNLKFSSLKGPLQVVHRPGQPLMSPQTAEIGLMPQKARVYAPQVMRYKLHYSKVENYYGVN